MKGFSVSIALALLLSVAPAAAQDRASLQDYATAISTAFVNDPDGFIARYGSTPATDRLVRADLPRLSGSPHIIRWNAREKTATILLSGHAELDDSGNETSASLRYSGLHSARWTEMGWKIEARTPFSVNRIRTHRIAVQLDPSVGLSAVDEMEVTVGTDQGFFFGLNTGAVIDAVTIDGRSVPFLFQDGFAWVDAPKGSHRVSVQYHIKVERTPGGNSAMFADAYGHIRNQYWWHPFFGFGVDEGLADFQISIRAPERLKLAVDLPQTDAVVEGQRTVVARSSGPIAAVSFAYDEAWAPVDARFGEVTLSVFATPDYTPKTDQLVAAANETWDLLAGRFGAPPLDRISVIQARGRNGTGWHFFSNQALFTGAAGGVPSRINDFPVRAFFDHEVAHLWTRPSGAARNFLAEGWSTYAEGLVIERRYGAEARRWFWNDQARLFLINETAMAGALNDDPSNAGVSYAKGAWTLAMLERVLGRQAFDTGVRAYVAEPLGRTDYDSFVQGFGPSADVARRFLTPWVEGRGAPRIALERQGDQLILVQNGAVYWLPRFSCGLERDDGSVEWRTLEIDGARTPLSGADRVVRVRLDPAGDYLLAGDRVLEANAVSTP